MEKPLEFDESTIRKKLTEYESFGIIEISKDGNKSVYSLSEKNGAKFGILRAKSLGEGVAEDSEAGWSEGKAFPS